ncbi:MAG: hypothetical protein BYD32DRAFT_404627, partial [Podila humilis]
CGSVEANFGSRSEQSENNTTASSFWSGPCLSSLLEQGVVKGIAACGNVVLSQIICNVLPQKSKYLS